MKDADLQQELLTIRARLAQLGLEPKREDIAPHLAVIQDELKRLADASGGATAQPA